MLFLVRSRPRLKPYILLFAVFMFVFLIGYFYFPLRLARRIDSYVDERISQIFITTTDAKDGEIIDRIYKLKDPEKTKEIYGIIKNIFTIRTLTPDYASKMYTFHIYFDSKKLIGVCINKTNVWIRDFQKGTESLYALLGSKETMDALENFLETIEPFYQNG